MLNNKNKIKVIIYKKNRQIVRKKVEPKNNTFTIDNQSYIIDKENFYIDKNIAVYSYREEVPIPLQLKDLKVEKGKESIEFEKFLMSSEELNTFKRSKTAREILDTIDNKIPEGIFGLISIAVIVIGFGALYYVLNEQMVALQEQLQILSEGLGITP